ncbi:MAG TPA: DUF3768 domain-containing protein, partial [Stellaceae bacterium]|nr:DUF3768 domain-containing protein [Stellaceae bacterium]
APSAARPAGTLRFAGAPRPGLLPPTKQKVQINPGLSFRLDEKRGSRQFRTTMTGGRVMLTAGIDALPSDVKALVIRRVATFSEFNADNDPHKEHDFGSFEVAGQKLFFKLDYYDVAMEFGSEDPADPSKTTRVLTIMLASEY